MNSYFTGCTLIINTKMFRGNAFPSPCMQTRQHRYVLWQGDGLYLLTVEEEEADIDSIDGTEEEEERQEIRTLGNEGSG